MCNIVAIISCILVSIFLKKIELNYLSEQIMIIGMWRAFLDPLDLASRLYKELDRNEYPFKGYKKVKVHTCFKKGYQTEVAKVPVEFILLKKMISIGCILFSILLWIGGRLLPDDLYFFTGVYALYDMVVSFTAICFFYSILFRKIYKRYTIHNWWRIYTFSGYKNPPQRAKLGTCMIIKEEKRRRRNYYTVKVKKSGNMYDKVMYCGEGMCKIDREHTLYEICGVRYIM